MFKLILRSTYKTYHGKLGYFFLLLLMTGSSAHVFLLKTIWPVNIYDPIIGFDLSVFPHPVTPSSSHLLGTDPLGRDVLSMFLAGSEPLIKLSIVSFITGLVSSLLVGTFVPFLFRRFDLVLREFSSGLVLISPPIVLLILGTGDFLEKLSPETVGFIYGLLGGLGVCYLVISTRVKELINSEFLNASRVIGASELQIALRHILPLIIPYSVALMLSVTTSGIVAYGFASFFGQVGWTPNWGMMIYDAITYGSYLGGTNLWNLLPPTFGFIFCSSSFYLISISVKKQFGISF